MDIAKIRKKAREKEERKAAQEREEPSEERGSGPPEAGTEGSEAVPEEPDDATEPGEYAGQRDGRLAEVMEAEAVAVMPEETAEEPGEPGEMSSREAGNVLELLAFSIAGKEFAFRVADVEEIIPFQGITSVPLVPVYVSGIMSLRGKIIPVIDLKTRFGLAQSAPGFTSSESSEAYRRKEKILILSGPKGLIGASVDKIKGVLRFPENSVLAPPAHLTEEERRFIEGVVILERRFISIVRFGDAVNIEVG